MLIKFDQTKETYQNTVEDRKFQYILKPSEYASKDFLVGNNLTCNIRENDLEFLVYIKSSPRSAQALA